MFLINILKQTLAKTLLGPSIILFFTATILLLYDVLNINFEGLAVYFPKDSYNENDIIEFIFVCLICFSFIQYMIEKIFKITFPPFSNKINILLHLIFYFIFLIDIYIMEKGINFGFIFIPLLLFVVAFGISSIYVLVPKYIINQKNKIEKKEKNKIEKNQKNIQMLLKK